MVKQKKPKFYSLEEQETVVQFDQGSQTATIYTASPVMLNKFDKLKYPVINETFFEGHLTSRTYEVDKKQISFRGERKKGTRVMSEEHKKKLQEARSESKS